MTESTANWTQVAISALTFLVFVGLAFITYSYARDTKKMANIMRKEFEVRSRPFVDVRIGIPFMLDDCSGFRIPLEFLLLGEFPFRLTKLELEIALGEEEILKLALQKDITLTRQNPSLKRCMEGFSDQKIFSYYEARRKDSSKREIQVSCLNIYCKSIEEKEELFQRFPVPYRNYYELDNICSKDFDISTFGRRTTSELEKY